MDTTLGPAIGSMVSHFRVLRRIGGGGMGVVYEAEDQVLGRRVALKFLPEDLARDSASMERLLREARAASALNHPSICTVHDLGEADGRPFIVMELLQGRTFKHLIGGRPLPVEQVLELGAHVAAGLEAAHRQGIVHRDIKPANIFATEGGQAKILDFGLVKLARVGSASGTSEAPTAIMAEPLTSPGATVGTAAYMSPEQVRGHELDARTDVFSLGVVLFEMATGVRPFHGSSTQELFNAILTASPLRASALNPEVPEEVDRIIEKSLEKDRELRYQSASELRADLRRLQRARESGSTTAARAPIPARGRWRRGVALLALAGVVLAVGLSLGRRLRFGGGHSAADPPRIAVLPFVNLGAAEDELFVEGMTDEVRTALSSLPGLQVIARASANQYRKTAKPPEQIGRELGVRYLLTGTIQWDRIPPPGTPRIRVTPELVEVRSGSAPTTAWQRSFDAEVSRAFDVQSRIATEVAQALVGSLAARGLAAAGRSTAHPEAYEAFLRGQSLYEGGAVGDLATLRRAAASLQQAVEIDPAFARAWAELSRVQATISVNTADSGGPAEASLKAAERAVALAPDLPDARLAAGNYYRSIGGDPGRAFQEYALALRAAPSNAEVLGSLGSAEQNLGRWEDSLEHLRRARSLDPRSVGNLRRLTITLLYLRRHADALSVANEGLELAPRNLGLLLSKTAILLAQGDREAARELTRSPPPGVGAAELAAFLATYWDLYWVLDGPRQALLFDAEAAAFGGSTYRDVVLAEVRALRGEKEKTRDHAEAARRALEARVASDPGDSELLSLLGLMLAYLGQADEAVRHGERAAALVSPSRDAYYGPYRQHQLVRIYLLVGNREKALDLLEPLMRMPYHVSPAWLRIDPTFAPLRGHPRFERLAQGRS